MAGCLTPWRAFQTGGYSAFFSISVSCSVRIPGYQRSEGLPELIIEALRPHLEQIVRAGLAPSHLLLLHHALAHDLIHRGLCEGR
jgi:hypothetical protein